MSCIELGGVARKLLRHFAGGKLGGLAGRQLGGLAGRLLGGITWRAGGRSKRVAETSCQKDAEKIAEPSH